MPVITAGGTPPSTVEQVGNNKAGQHDTRGKKIQFQTLLAECIEKAGTNINADGIHKQYQSEFTNKLQNFRIGPGSEMSNQNPRKKHSGNAQLDPL